MPVRSQNTGCRDFRNSLVSRRDVLRMGVLGAGGIWGLNLPQLLQAEQSTKSTSEKSLIILWMRGGPSHIDMWDPKPHAPTKYRGEFGTISTGVPGIHLSDMMPMCGKVMDKWSMIRSLHHHDAGHSAADQICFTGYDNGPQPDVNIHPSIGSIVSKQQSHLSPDLPSYVMIPRMVPGTGAAYLGPSHKPFETQADPANPGPFKMQNFELPSGVTTGRSDERRSLLEHFDGFRREIDAAGEMRAMDDFQAKAFEILSSTRTQQAFDLDAEPDHIRQRYGFQAAFDPGASNRCGAPAWSQRILLARRLVEAGVRLVTVDLRWWDTHVQGFDSLRRGFLPRYDQAYSALIEDLDQRGLLDSTMVVSWGEFGRTPRVNKDAGRDHYPNVFSAAVAGGGIQGGRAIGESDTKGAFPKANPKTPQDVLATMYRHLGIDTEMKYLDHNGRPYPVLPSGTPIDELF